MFSVVPYIRFLSLVELKHWLAEVVVFPSSILMESILVLKMLPGKILPRPLFTLPQGSGVQTNRDEGFYHLSLLWQQTFILHSPSGNIKSLTKMPPFY